jgi:hypothetical protein
MVLHGQDVVNTLWFRKFPGGFSESDLGDLNTDLIDWWDTNVSPSLSSNLSLVEVTSTDQSSSSAPSVVTMTAVPGGLTGEAGPGSNCITIKFTTNERGRSGRGRNYISGLREVDVNGNTYDAGRISELVAGYDLLRTAPLLSGAAVWNVVSHFTAGSARESGYAIPITGVSVADNAIDSQRRRLTGRGS